VTVTDTDMMEMMKAQESYEYTRKDLCETSESSNRTPSDTLELILHDWIDALIRRTLREIEKERETFLASRYARCLYRNMK